MNNKFRMFAMTFGLSVVMGSTQLSAGDSIEKAEVPFDFQAGSLHLAAGPYTIIATSTALRLRNDETRKTVVVGHSGQNGTATHGKGALVFHKYGNRRFLSEIMFASQTAGNPVIKSKLEKEMAAAPGRPEVAYIAMR